MSNAFRSEVLERLQQRAVCICGHDAVEGRPMQQAGSTIGEHRDGDPRPEIEISPDLHAVCNQALTALAGDTELYQYAGALVTVVEPENSACDGRAQIRFLSAAALRTRL